LNEEKIREFADTAHRKRGFPFDKNTDIIRVLTHLDLIKGDKVTNAALLLFSDRPQRYFITSEVRCAHFHGLKATKPIPSYQVYKGNVFEMIDSAVDFVLSKINLYVSDRSKGVQVDVRYDLPVKAVTETIVNAVAHRDYTSNASVQVMLFPDRLEVLNPGRLPVGLTIEELYNAHRSIPANPLLAESLYLFGTIERMGTGTGDIVDACMEMDLKRPEFKQGSGFQVVLFRKGVSDSNNIKNDVQENNGFYGGVNSGDGGLTGDESDKKNVLDNVQDNDQDKNGINVHDKKTAVRQNKVLEILCEDPGATLSTLASLLSVSTKTIQRDLAELRNQRRIERVGSDASGHWRIIKS
jgi:predicted HTH transcriptional regulator